MNTQAFVNAVILKATGKASTIQPGSTKYIRVIDMANGMIDEYQYMPDVDWNSTYDPFFELAVVDANDTYTLPETIKKVSDDPSASITIKIPGQDDVTYRTVSPQLLYEETGKVCSIIGRTLRFPHSFSNDDKEFGHTVYAPVYSLISKLSSSAGHAADPVPVDIAQWLVIRTAAEYTRSDMLKQNQYGNLLAEANQFMQRMMTDNEASQASMYVGGSWRMRTGGV